MQYYPSCHHYDYDDNEQRGALTARNCSPELIEGLRRKLNKQLESGDGVNAATTAQLLANAIKARQLLDEAERLSSI